MRVLHVDENHKSLPDGLNTLGLVNDFDYTASKEEIMQKIGGYQGLVIRSRFPIDTDFLDAAKSLQFIARVGSGLENIDTTYAQSKGIHVISAPEGNSNAVAEHALGMLLTLFNKLIVVHHELQDGVWQREPNRGEEVDGKVIGLIGYGNTGKAFARKLQGFDVEILCCDILPDVEDRYARQVSLDKPACPRNPPDHSLDRTWIHRKNKKTFLDHQYCKREKCGHQRLNRGIGKG